MKMTQDLAKLLDRLYNLKGEDNVIIAGINNNIKEVEDKVVNEAKKQSENEVLKIETESQLSIFMTQKEAFCSTFTGINNDTFKALAAIGVDLDITGMLDKIEENSPKYCDELNNKINNAIKSIEEAKKERERLNEELDRLNAKLDNANEDRNQLVSLLEQSLSPNVLERESLTAKYAKDIISRFGVFSSSEISSLAKVILFPEDGLIEFDETYDEREHETYTSAANNDNLEIDVAEADDESISDNIFEETNDDTIDTYQNDEKDDESSEKSEISYRSSEIDLSQIIPENGNLTSQTYKDIKNDEDSKQPSQIFDITSLNGHDDSNDGVIEDIPKIEDIPNDMEKALNEFNLEEEPVILSSNNDDEDNTEDISEKDNNSNNVEEEAPQEIQDIAEKTDKYSELKRTLEDNNILLDKLERENIDYNFDTILEKLDSIDIKHIEENFEILRSINVSEDVIYKYYDGYMYLADQDLNKKVTLLRAKGISENKIKDLISDIDSGLKEDYQVIEKRIDSIENNNEKITDDNVHLLSLDTNKYNDNLEILANNGYEIDDKDLRNYQAVLYNSSNVKEDVEVLKNYLISIQRKNGKYALGMFYKNAKELLFDIDDVLEADLEEMLNVHPEILVNRVDALIARTKYVSSNGESIYEDEENGIFNKNVLDGLKFYRTYNHDVNEYIPRDRKEVNVSLDNLIGSAQDSIDTLDKYYDNTVMFKDVELSKDEKELYNNLKSLLEEKLKVENNGIHTYLVKGVAISKNKVERNLAVLVKGKDNVEGIERSIILSAVLYNLRQSEDVLKQIIDAYDNNSSIEDGGEK